MGGFDKDKAGIRTAIMLASMYMYGGSIWAVATAHALWDIAMAAEKGPGSLSALLWVAVFVVLIIGFPVLCIRLTGGYNCRKILERFEKRRNKRKALG